MKDNIFKVAFKRKRTIVWAAVSVFLIALFIVLTVLENTLLFPILTTVLGGPTPVKGPDSLNIYTSDYDSKEESKRAGDELNVKIAEEGFTLLLNENNALPIETSASSKKKVSVFGKNSVNLVLGGSGSGGISGDSAATIYDGLELGNFDVNPTLKKFYQSSASGGGRSAAPELSESSSAAPTLDIGETPVSRYTAEVRGSFAEYNDAAFVVISRLGGESWDLPRSQNPKAGGIEDNHYLQLDQNEYDMLDMVTSRFKNVIVVLNTLTSFQCDFIEEYNNTPSDPRIDAVMWIGGPGTTGARAFGNLVNGTVNPSGRTTDIYAKDFTLDPTWQNFGDNSQVNEGKNGSALLENGSNSGRYAVSYEEGVYLGYRYYETRGYEEVQAGNADWYDNNVVFPFGYGLSYSKFDQEFTDNTTGSLTGLDSKLSFEVSVKNIEGKPGKDVVQLYVSKPYYRNGIEKSYVELVDFAKTDILSVGGEPQKIKFTVNAYDLASYDYNDANENGKKGYELEHGEYKFFISANSHVDEYAYDTVSFTLGDDLYFEKDPNQPVTKDTVKVENRYTTEQDYEDENYSDFNDLQYRLSNVIVGGKTRKGMSRTNFASTFPTAPTAAERALLAPEGAKSEKDVIADFSPNNTYVTTVTETPKMNQSGELTLLDLVDKETGYVDFYDERWDALLDRLSFDEMKDLVNYGAFQTSSILKIKKNLTNDSDGPIGFVNFMPGMSDRYKGNTTFACEIVIGATWNKDLAYQMGKIVGDNGIWGYNGIPYSGWYAPAVNLHRSPFSGRNFEYYSEDPVLSGKMAVYVINGAMKNGVYTDLKHFALNDQETNRSGIATFCTEQALRELYLKPFEIAVKANADPAHSASATADGFGASKAFRGTTGVMSSFNRIGTRWTGGDYRLLTEILRNEWGFRGLVICDYKSDNQFMDAKQMLYAGNDLILASLENLMWMNPSASSAQDVTVLRTAAKNILYTVANSNSINIDIVGYNMEWWRVLTIVLDVLVGVGICVWGFFMFWGAYKLAKKNEAATATESAEKPEAEQDKTEE